MLVPALRVGMEQGNIPTQSVGYRSPYPVSFNKSALPFDKIRRRNPLTLVFCLQTHLRHFPISFSRSQRYFCASESEHSECNLMNFRHGIACCFAIKASSNASWSVDSSIAMSNFSEGTIIKTIGFKESTDRYKDQVYLWNWAPFFSFPCSAWECFLSFPCSGNALLIFSDIQRSTKVGQWSYLCASSH